MEKMTAKYHHYILISLLIVLLLNIGLDEAHCDSSAEAAATSLDTQNQFELQPPDWQIGDTWVVETEIFDQGNIMKRSDAMGWTEKQTWRFEVLGIESIDNRPCHHLQISPINGNACPYNFGLWLRIADLQLTAFQIFYPADDSSSNGRPPRSVRKHISGSQTPTVFFDYFKARFPSLPIWLLPKFNTGETPSAARAGDRPGPHTKLGQKIITHSTLLPSDQASAALLPHPTAKTDSGPYHQVTLTYGDAQEIQYWEDGHPWPVYGYKSGKNGMEKLYRLTHIERKSAPE
jgi:hypothetical protein